MDAGRDPSAFCAEVGGRLTGSLVLFCGDRALGEELAQEALIRALERWPRVSRLDSPEAWVFHVGFNLARSARRQREAEGRARSRLARERERHAELPDTAVALAVREAINALPPRQRAVVLIRYYAELDVRETARAMHCAEGTVKSLTHKAIAALRVSGLVVDPEEVIDAGSQ
jgi:RNA polymerase sigma-70 factor (ECF subfamily)